ncbi:TPA: HD family hydrolase [Methanopyrus kandleri]|uniref:5'-deoxynucleotidase n=2 Tax=Methanopyrus kandleri TaxID=2320 RepID=Q8TZ99_METKA|nr:Predicted hydrolase of the HD superfamily [Methanopyrus kandleri AV19]HII70825.1 HD family hydrolase [Methanopyrus kandleri]
MDVEAVYRLKRILRTGWLVRGIPRSSVESVAEHSFGAAMLAWEICHRLAERGIDVDPYKTVVMALIHDLPEALTLDLDVEASRVFGDAKREAEEKAAECVFDEELLDLWREFERRESPEAKAAKLADTLDMALQALEYSQVGFEAYREFLDSAEREARELGREYLLVFKEILRERGWDSNEGGGKGSG